MADNTGIFLYDLHDICVKRGMDKVTFCNFMFENVSTDLECCSKLYDSFNMTKFANFTQKYLHYENDLLYYDDGDEKIVVSTAYGLYSVCYDVPIKITQKFSKICNEWYKPWYHDLIVQNVVNRNNIYMDKCLKL